MKKIFQFNGIRREIYIFAPTATAMLLALLLIGCSSAPSASEQPAETAAETSAEEGELTPEKRISILSNQLSRTQTRLEELDAKISALTDKVQSHKTAIDNLAGAKPITVAHVENPEKPELAVETKSKQPAPTNSNEPIQREFEMAMSLFRKQKFTDAVLAFTRFTEHNPDHILSGSAQFFAGESYYKLKEYKLALNEFAKVPSRFQSSPRVPSALVRMAHCYQAIGQAKEANRTMALARDLYDGNPSLDLSDTVNHSEHSEHSGHSNSPKTQKHQETTTPTSAVAQPEHSHANKTVNANDALSISPLELENTRLESAKREVASDESALKPHEPVTKHEK